MASHNQPNASQITTQHLKSAVIKRSVVIAGRKTSVSLEDAFWGSLKDIAHSRHMTLSDIVSYIDGHRNHGNLSSTIRLFVLEYACAQRQAAAEDAAAQRATHGNCNPG
jgi:predicted DNA-binding ribbon-helix-helix protein